MKPVWSVGLMTGTVLDGNIDVALLNTDGESITAFGPYALLPYEDGIVTLLEEAQSAARVWNFVGQEPAIFATAEDALTRAQAQAVKQVVEQAGMSMSDIGVVGFHGQTVLHRGRRPDQPGDTRQLGNGALMHSILGAKVVYDFRTADIRAGGQGAPLAAAYHAALLGAAGARGDNAILNLGGVGNITWWDGKNALVAFDTGPANAPINDFVKARGLGNMDRDGALAATGRVDEVRLAQLLEHPYLKAAYPKSLDRFDFAASMADGLEAADGAALLTAFTAACIGKALDLLPQRPSTLYVSGGGRHNPILMAMIAQRAGVKAISADSIGWRGDAVEAECFAFLAVRALRGLPISFPGTTGVPHPLTGGRIVGGDIPRKPAG